MVQPTARPPFPGIKPEDLQDRHGNFDADTVAEGISRALRLHFEDFRRTPTKEEIASLQALILNHGSRHSVPASPGGEDPLDISRLFDEKGIREAATAEATPNKLGRIKIRGDIYGTAEKPEVRSIRGVQIDPTGAADTEVLTFNAATGVFEPAPGGAGGGDNVSVNGVACTNVDLDDATPAAPADGIAVRWQKDALNPSNVSANVPTSPSGSTTTVGTARTISTTSPLTGGGDLSANRTLAFDSAVALDNQARVMVRKNSGADVGARRRLNLIQGTGVSLTIADDPGSEEVDITISTEAASADPPEGSYQPGSYTIINGKFRLAAKRQEFKTTDRATINGTGRLSIYN